MSAGLRHLVREKERERERERFGGRREIRRLYTTKPVPTLTHNPLPIFKGHVVSTEFHGNFPAIKV